MKVGDKVVVTAKSCSDDMYIITPAVVTEEVDDGFENGHNGDWVDNSYFKAIGDNGKMYSNAYRKDNNTTFYDPLYYMSLLKEKAAELQKNILIIEAMADSDPEKEEHESLKMCGYFGCHVRNSGECECVHCSAYQTKCNNCTKFPNLVRGSLFFSEAMSEKCKLCKNLNRQVKS